MPDSPPSLPGGLQLGGLPARRAVRAPAGPLGQVGLALAWLLAALAGAGAVGTLAMLAAAKIWRQDLEFTDGGFIWPACAAFQLITLLAALRRAGRVGAGSRRAGAGWLPVTRGRLVVGLAVLGAAFNPALAVLAQLVPAYQNFARQNLQEAPLDPDGSLAGYALGCIAFFAIGAPVTEELFFRGWLWVALRRRWSAWATGGTTGLLFLLAHAAAGWASLLMLVPVVVLLTWAREAGESVRASLLVHLAVNAVAVAFMVVERWAG